MSGYLFGTAGKVPEEFNAGCFIATHQESAKKENRYYKAGWRQRLGSRRVADFHRKSQHAELPMTLLYLPAGHHKYL